MFKIGRVAKAIVSSLETESEKWEFDHFHARRRCKKHGDEISIWIANEVYGLKLESPNAYPFNYWERRLIYKTVQRRINVIREAKLAIILKKFI